MIKVGIFWAIPDKVFGQRVLEFHKSFYTSEADCNGFINYPYSHYEVWDEKVRGYGDDCYKYPRGRIIYDTKRGKHRIFADKCIPQSTIDEIANCAATSITFVVFVYLVSIASEQHSNTRFCAAKTKSAKT